MSYKREIRGFKSGRFHADDGSATIVISRSDDSVIVEVADEDADTIHKFNIPIDADSNSEVPFEFGMLSEQRQSEQEL